MKIDPLSGGFDSAKTFEKGYRPTDWAKAVIKYASRTNTVKSLATLLGDHLAIGAIAALGYGAWMIMPLFASVPLIIVGMIAVTRFQRGLECMVHEGSHYNFVRGNGRCSKFLNDLVTNALAAVPTFVTVASFRASHWLHHEHFGNEDDPDLLRYRHLRIEYMKRAQAGSFIAGMIARILPYVAGWWMALGFSPTTIMLGLAWHVLVWLLPLSMAIGFSAAVTVWLAFWVIPFNVILPFSRFLAESGKHQYADTGTVAAATISNVGPLHQWFLHPHGDGYHLLHHLFPFIPHHKMRTAHELLVAVDPSYRNQHKHRTAVFQDPVVGEAIE